LACNAGTKTIQLKTNSNENDSGDAAHFDIKNEIEEFEKDLNFLQFIQSDDVYNVERFIQVFICQNHVFIVDC